ncbi:IS3 family transposase [Paenibacillus alvei]|uniref:IS3 family transposase n=1 Tax=Paenibacillus alvei TaxID=44250 RepID=UPI0009DC16D4
MLIHIFSSLDYHGSRKVWDILKKQDIKVSENIVARIMKELGLISRTVNKYKSTTNSKHHLPIAENVLDQHEADIRKSRKQ